MDNLMGFASEKQLFQTVVESIEFQHLANLYPNTTSLVEPSGLFGVPDLVIASLGRSYCEVKAFAFEMKLSNWQRALVQAFRYRAFAELSFVVMDHKHIKPALACISRFERAHIGLLSINTAGELFVHHQPEETKPYCDTTRATFEQMLRRTDLGQRITLQECYSAAIPRLVPLPHSFTTDGHFNLYPSAGAALEPGTVHTFSDNAPEILLLNGEEQNQSSFENMVCTSTSTGSCREAPPHFDLSLDELEIS
jgi:hypothetical protein